MGDSPQRDLTSPVTPAMYPRRSRNTWNSHAELELSRTLARFGAPPSGGALAAGEGSSRPSRSHFMKKPTNPSGGSAEMRQILHKQRREEPGKAAGDPGRAAGGGARATGRGCSRRWTAAKVGRGCRRRKPAAGHGRRLKTGDHDLACMRSGRPGRDDRAARSFVEWALRGSNPRPAD